MGIKSKNDFLREGFCFLPGRDVGAGSRLGHLLSLHGHTKKAPNLSLRAFLLLTDQDSNLDRQLQKL